MNCGEDSPEFSGQKVEFSRAAQQHPILLKVPGLSAETGQEILNAVKRKSKSCSFNGTILNMSEVFPKILRVILLLLEGWDKLSYLTMYIFILDYKVQHCSSY